MIGQRFARPAVRYLLLPLCNPALGIKMPTAAIQGQEDVYSHAEPMQCRALARRTRFRVLLDPSGIIQFTFKHRFKRRLGAGGQRQLQVSSQPMHL